MCDMEYMNFMFGVGAESRGTPTKFPEGTGLVVSGDDSWTANIHVLRTVDIDPAWGVKACIECHGPNQWLVPLHGRIKKRKEGRRRRRRRRREK